MFEAVFILTVLDSGTRVIRFVVQELVGDVAALRGRPAARSPVWITSALAVLGWGLILSWGIVDREGGTRALIRMFGTSNQLLAVIALALATIVMLKRHRGHAWITGLPALAVATTTLCAGILAIFAADPRVGALAAARAAATPRAIQNAWLTAGLTGTLLAFVVAVLWVTLRKGLAVARAPEERC
jgi:carbon starvation protein